MLEEIFQRLKLMDQLHLAVGADTLSLQEQEAFLKQLQPGLFFEQQERFRNIPPVESLEPVLDAEHSSSELASLGLPQGKVATIILAGGQGSRLSSSLPKALVPIIGSKTLLEFHLEKIQNAPCAIITSAANHAQIAAFLKNTPFTPTLVEQNAAPFFDDQGKWILKKPGVLASGPDGNGHALHLLSRSGVLEMWKKQGIQQISIIPIDNPLANPLDPILSGCHAARSSDVTIKVIRKKSPQEKTGICVHKNGRICVQEYSEQPVEYKEALAFIGLFMLSLPFAERVVQTDLPWHLARKQDPSSGAWIWKFERFIFDIFDLSKKTHLLLCDREKTYAPLKNASGEQSLETVRQALRYSIH